MINAVLGLLGIWTLGVGYFFFKDICVHQKNLEQETHLGLNVGIGFLTDFLDTLGIGSFAVTTALFRGFKQVKDRLLPGTLNVGHALPTVCEALAFLTVIKVEFWTLVSMIAASVVGALGGAGIVSRLPERKIRLVMGFALLVTDFLMISGQMGWIEALGVGNAIGLQGVKLIIAIIGNFILGVLMTAGVGLYAPCMALVYLLGMSPAVAFPIMMGSCAFLMPPASLKFIKAEAYNRKAALGLTVGGIFGVLAAVYIVKSLPLKVLTWVVIGVIFITGLTLIRAALKSKSE
jgi:uncharacterized membrane protein YfcA